MTVAAEVNSLALGGSIDGPTTERHGQRELTEQVFQAAKHCGLQEKELAIALGYDPAYLSRIKAGEKSLPTSRLTRLPRSVRRTLWTMVAEEDGLIVAPDDVRRRAIAKLLVALGEVMAVLEEPRKRMAKATAA